MYKIKKMTPKRFFLQGPLKGDSPVYYQGIKQGFNDSGDRGLAPELKKRGFGGIEYALKALNGEIEIDITSQFAGVEGGPASPLSYWFTA